MRRELRPLAGGGVEGEAPWAVPPSLFSQGIQQAREREQGGAGREKRQRKTGHRMSLSCALSTLSCNSRRLCVEPVLFVERELHTSRQFPYFNLVHSVFCLTATIAATTTLLAMRSKAVVEGREQSGSDVHPALVWLGC